MAAFHGISKRFVRLQNQHLSVGHAAERPLRNLFHGLRLLLEEPQGLRSLWRGNWSNVLRVLPTYGARFGLFGYFDSLLTRVEQGDTRREGGRWRVRKGISCAWLRFRAPFEAFLKLT